MFFVDIQPKNKNIWIISKRVGVILRIQGSKNSRVRVKYIKISIP